MLLEKKTNVTSKTAFYTSRKSILNRNRHKWRHHLNHVNNNKSLSVLKKTYFLWFHENIHKIVSKQCIVFLRKSVIFISCLLILKLNSKHERLESTGSIRIVFGQKIFLNRWTWFFPKCTQGEQGVFKLFFSSTTTFCIEHVSSSSPGWVKFLSFWSLWNFLA